MMSKSRLRVALLRHEVRQIEQRPSASKCFGDLRREQFAAEGKIGAKLYNGELARQGVADRLARIAHFKAGLNRLPKEPFQLATVLPLFGEDGDRPGSGVALDAVLREAGFEVTESQSGRGHFWSRPGR
jgi:hypothetical protein